MKNGGQVAINGFKLQALWTLLDGLGRDDWTAVTIEPTADDGGLEKIDVRWELLGVARHDQVKGTINSFGQAEVRRWVAEFATSGLAPEKRLVLFGVPASGVPVSCTVDGVEVQVRHRDEETLSFAAAYLLERHCRDLGVEPAYGHSERLVELLVGLLLGRSGRGHRWTRQDLRDEIAALVEGLRGNSYGRQQVDARERADRVQAAMRRHGMSRASEKATSSRGILLFKTCEWPPPTYADPDGYHEVRVQTVRGPGGYEATGTNYADRITMNSPFVEVAYSFSGMGQFAMLTPFAVARGAVVDADGRPYDGSDADLGFLRGRDEIVVLHNHKRGLDSVRALAKIPKR